MEPQTDANGLLSDQLQQQVVSSELLLQTIYLCTIFVITFDGSESISNQPVRYQTV
jgi:hypothetical protein